MACLIDVNVIIPIIIQQHTKSESAVDWWDPLPTRHVVLSLPVRMATLRLLTNPKIMGEDVLPPEDAWRIWSRFSKDERTREDYGSPEGLDTYWLSNVLGRVPTPKLWTDAWLAAFAETSGLEMVTFDQDFRSFHLSRLKLLS